MTLTNAALNITGDLTVTLRVWRKPGAADQVMFEMGNVSGTGAAGNVIYLMGATPAGKLLYYRETGVQVGLSYVSALDVTPDWCFCSVRRVAGGNLRMGVNGVYQDIVATPSTGGTNVFMTLGNEPNFGLVWQGGMADVSIWNTVLTDAQLEPLWRTAMGL
jgi:hypothetical protein